MELINLLGFGLIAGALALVVRRFSPELGMQLSIAAGAIIFIMVITKLAPIAQYLNSLAVKYGVKSEYIGIVLKIIAIAYLAEFGVQVLKDAGEGAIASKVEFGGKVLIAVLALPIMGALIEIIAGIMP